MTELEQYRARLVTAQQELADAQSEARKANDRLAVAQLQVDGLSQIVAGLTMLEAQATKEELPEEEEVAAVIATMNGDAPRGREAVRRIMQESGRAWKQADLIAEVKRLGWVDPQAKDPDAAIRMAVRRLARDGEVEKVPGMAGVYRYKASGVTTPEEAARTAGEPEATTSREV